MLSREQVLRQIRENVHHPATSRELLQILRVPRTERPTFRRLLKALVSDGDLIQIRGHRFGLPEKMDLVVGRLQTHPAGYGFVIPDGRSRRRRHLHLGHQRQRSDARRPRGRAHRASRRRPRRRPDHPHPRARPTRPIVGRYDRDDDGMGFVVPFDRRVLMDVHVPPERGRRAEPGEMVIVELTRWPTATRGAARPRHRGARRHRRARRRHRDHHPQVRHSRRARRRGVAEAVRARRRRSDRRHRAAAPTSGRCRPSPSTASTRATSTTRSRSSGWRTGTTGSACTSPTSRTTSRRQRARSRGLRARHVGLLPGARRPHVPGGAGDRPVQAQSARRSAGAVVPDGDRSPRRRRPRTSSTTGSSTATSG